MSIPTIPGVPSAGGNLSIGPDGISASFNVALDLCNARPIFVYVTQQKGAPPAAGGDWPRVEPAPPGMPPPPPPPPAPIDRPPSPGDQKGGQIWRLFDPLAKTEKLPIWMEWTKEKEYPDGHWKPHYRQPPPPERPPPPPVRPPIYVCTEVITIGDTEERSYFKFDKPKCDLPTSQYPTAFNDHPALTDVKGDIDRVADAISAPAQRQGGDNGTVPLNRTPFERKVIVFGHADMCAPFWYNFGLSHRRNVALGMVMTSHPRGNEVRSAQFNTGRSGGYVPCSDFNPDSGPTAHELAAETATTTRTIGGSTFLPGFAPRPASQSFDGNPGNRRIELFVIPDYKPSSGKPSEIAKVLSQVRSELLSSAGISAAEWPDGQFPCPKGITTCPSPGHDNLVNVCHALSSPEPGPHQSGSGPGIRQCRFYKRFTEEARNIKLTDEECHEEPQPQPPPQPEPDPNQPVFDHWEWIEDAPKKETQGEYHPPRGEHYSYYMDEMVKDGVNARDLFAPAVAVAPNDRVNPDDFNLIKAGSIRVVKLDIGFWGDERTRESDPTQRRSGFRRVPKRYFGLVEGQFVFNCYLETPETRGYVRPCSEGFDEKLTPLCFKLDQELRKKNFGILIMAKAVAEDGPDKKRLKVFFPDMHMPRKFDDKDPEYASDKCIRRVQAVKSMVLHQLKRDYRLTASLTPWLTSLDRRMCRDFFENNAPKLKLPHIYTLNGPKLGSRTTSDDNIVAQAADAARSAYNFLMQVGFRMFTFTQEDYRRMVRTYPENFPEKGYGRTKDVLFNWFYGFETDRNQAPAKEGTLDRTAKNLVPDLAQDVLDKFAGTKLAPSEGRKPAQESYDRVEPGPARDLIRLLKVIQDLQTKQRTPIDVFQTGDLYEIWANRRFLFEDFHECDDFVGQLPEMAQSVVNGLSFGGAGSLLRCLGDGIKGMLRMLLGGINAADHDLWWRRESNGRAINAQLDMDVATLPPEKAYNLDKFDPQVHLPRFTPPAAGPGIVGGGVTGPPGGGQISAGGLEYTRYTLGTQRQDGSLGPFPASGDRGDGYLTTEAQRRISQVEAFEAPLRQDDAGKREDLQLLGSNVTGRNRDVGRWNKAVVDAFRDVHATFIYGNHDCFRGVPRDGGMKKALPYYSEPGLWVEHGHRFEDSNLDGQPFGSFLTNLAYEIQELPYLEGLLDEFWLHREQDIFQPGIVQWFLLVQFGGNDFLRQHQRPRLFPGHPATDPPAPDESVPAIFPFRISVNSHTHVPDLVVAQIVFKDREVAKVDLPLLGSVSVQTLINVGGALLKGILFMEELIAWFKKWDDRNGFQKWWEDIKGNTINWGVDFAGLAQCIDKAIDAIKKQGQNTVDKLKKEWDASSGSFKNMANQNARNVGLPPPL